MKITNRLFAIFFFSLVLASAIQIPSQIANAAPITGEACAKQGLTQIIKSKKYYCETQGIKLVWDSGMPVKVKPGTKLTFSHYCQPDPLVPAEWAAYEKFAINTFNCARPYRFVKESLPKAKPKTELIENRVSVETCKIKQSRANDNSSAQIAFSTLNSPDIDLARGLNIQIVPVQFNDSKSLNSPDKDYGKYYKYLKDNYANISDGKVKLNFKVPNKYYQINKKISDYETGSRYSHDLPYSWKTLDMNSLLSDAISASDSDLDFSNVDMVILNIPPNTDQDYVGHGGGQPQQISTSEKTINYLYLFPSNKAINERSWFGVEPMIHMHELNHAWNKLADHVGDHAFGSVTGNAGTGVWGLMTGATTDLLTWDKWIINMLSDSQVICADISKNSTFWIKPSSYYGDHEKMLVIPVSNSKVIVLESMRATGLNYKLPNSAQGVLIYSVDVSKLAGGYGVDVIYPTIRPKPIFGMYRIYMDAPLKLKESVSTDNFKITVVESGNFGDVVKVERAS